MKIRLTVSSVIVFAALLQALPNYIGYSGAPGSKGTCSTSCHGSSSGGTITVTGFPQKYTPGASYPITVKRVGGSLISNFNCSTRKGTSNTAAGTFTVVSKAALYTVSGYESGVRASSNSIDSANFVWSAPAAATGSVALTVSGLQGSKSGAVTKLTLTSSENVTRVEQSEAELSQFSLEQNFPNPFNPVTTIKYFLPFKTSLSGRGAGGRVSLKVFDLLGHEVATLVNGWQHAGLHAVEFDATALPSGAYFYRLYTQHYTETKRLLLIK